MFHNVTVYNLLFTANRKPQLTSICTAKGQRPVRTQLSYKRRSRSSVSQSLVSLCFSTSPPDAPIKGKPFPARILLVPFLLDVQTLLSGISVCLFHLWAQLCRLPPRLHGRVDIEVRLASGRRKFPPSHEGATPPPAVSDVLGSLTRTLHQLSAVTGLSRDVELPRYDGSYKAQSFFINYDAQAYQAQLQYSTRLKKPPNLLQAPLRVTNTRAKGQRPVRTQLSYKRRSRFSVSQSLVSLCFSTSPPDAPIKGKPFPARILLVPFLLDVQTLLSGISVCLFHLWPSCVAFHHDCTVELTSRTCIKFCVKNEIKCADAFRMLTVAYGEATLDRSNVYRWYKMFSEGREDVNDEERAGRPSTSTTDEKINEVEKMILANRRITVREVAEDLNISIGSCHSIFINDLGMRRVAAKFVPKLLNCDQKQHRMNIANEMLDSVLDDPNLLQRVITGDEAWVYGYDVETKVQSSQWKLPHETRPKKARQVRSNVKILLTVFFDCRGVVHHEFLPQGGTVNEEYYLQVMHASICAKQSAGNARICRRTKIGFCITITPLLTHRCLCATFGQKQHTNDAAATVFPRSGPL
ncbi:hypothetical protein LAZ67_5004482 [Cordylochernes scorpioides]|uniref:Mos1 transposase HTH domain-containing protein n=1 Tax=Cordylochernes scorpioides TaxID=51811 RepID=A0ABY6KI18_9ARAC|nr:hypothetical protein LAZ67_5004482 [Cordylochernes scorpioides]